MSGESFNQFDQQLLIKMQKWGVPLLRISLGVVFLWFGALKVVNLSPVDNLVSTAYWFLPKLEMFIILGIAECIIGLGLIFKINLRLILPTLWVQMAGTIVALFLAPSLFFSGGNPLVLTLEGEFIAKNLVLIFASIVVGGYEVKPKAIEDEQVF